MYHSPSEANFDRFDEPRLHMERLLKAQLIEFDISLRILIPLESAGIRTLGDLVSQTKKSLLNIRMIGVAAVDKLSMFVHYHNLRFADE